MLNTKKAGYTILEVMMFLAISSTMFIVAFFGTSNARNGVAFRQSLNDIDLKIKEVFNNVDNGYFGNDGRWECKLSTDPTPIPSLSPAVDSSGGGNSVGCVFIGKMITFVDDSTMQIDTILATRSNNTVTSKPLELRQTYTINNAVKYKPNTSGNFVRATRTDAFSDLKAIREKSINGTAWTKISDPSSLSDPFCFQLDEKRRGYIIITQKDTIVSYNDNAGKCSW